MTCSSAIKHRALQIDPLHHLLFSILTGINGSKVPGCSCSNPILSTSPGMVTSRKSARFQLLGRARDGNVSLTIVHERSSDSGLYRCGSLARPTTS
ncbi:unnamed protein product [Lota lota]